MGKDNKAYLLQRAAEETAAAERSTCAFAASVHHELALRYSLRLLLPEPSGMTDDAIPVGLPKLVSQQRLTVPARRHSAKRSRG